MGLFMVAAILRNGRVVYCGQSVRRATASTPAALGDHEVKMLAVELAPKIADDLTTKR
jgi:hypothetical protein